MMAKKRLQVFISSTYTDLLKERQAAVEAILQAGHIPAGMELFAAGDKTQMEIIKKWIDESDVFLLILGARYGSIDPKSKKSYTHLEYLYASEKRMPLFALVISDEGLRMKSIKTDQLRKLKRFRKLLLERFVKFWTSTDDIKIAIHESLTNFSQSRSVGGWVRSSRHEQELMALRRDLDAHKRLFEMFIRNISDEEMYSILEETGIMGYFEVIIDNLLQGKAVNHDARLYSLHVLGLIYESRESGWGLTKRGTDFVLFISSGPTNKINLPALLRPFSESEE